LSKKKPTYAELQARLAQAEATLDALRRGEIDILVGEAGQLRIRLKSLVEENERLAQEWQTTFDTVQDAIWVLDAEQRILRANKAAEEVFGCPLAEMTGRRCFDIAHHTDEPIPGCPFCLMRVSRQRESFEMQLGERWFEVTTDPLVDENDNLIGAVHIASDITERKRAEDALQEMSQTLQAVIQASPLPILALDREGNVTLWNPAAERTFGWSQHQVLGCQNPAVPEERMDESQAMFLRVLGGNGFAGVETQRQRKDGSLIDVSISTAPLRDRHGNTSGVMAVIADITERKQAEEQLRAAHAELQRLLDETEHARRTLLSVIEDQKVTEQALRESEERLRRRLTELTILWESSQAFARLLDPTSIAQHIVNTLAQHMRWHHAAIRQKRPGSDELELLAFNQPGLLPEDTETVRQHMQRLVGRLGQGLSGHAIQIGQTIRTGDVTQYPQYVETFPGIRSGLYAPMKIGDEVIGVIAIESEETNAFSEHDERLLTTLAAQAAIAIENSRLFKAERSERQRLETLYRIGQTINSTLDADAILDHLTDEAMRATNATHGSALIIRPDLGCFERRSPRGYSVEQAARARNLPLPLNRGICSRACAARQTINIGDVQTDPDYFPLIPETRSELAVPILRGDKVLGTLDLQSPQANAFHDVDLNFLQALTDQVAIALENARLLQETRMHAQELQLLYELGVRLNSTLDLQTVLQLVADAARELLGAVEALVFVRQETGGTFWHSVSTLHPQHTPVARTPPRPGGLTEIIMHTSQPLIIPDIENDPRVSPDMRARGVRSQIGLPIQVGKHSIGVLFANSDRPDAFHEHDQELLSFLAAQASIAIQNALLFDDAIQRLQEMNIISSVALAGAAGQPFDEIVARTTKALSQRWPDVSVSLAFVDETDNTLRLHPSAHGVPPQVIASLRIPAGQGITGWALQEQRAVRLDDVTSDPRYIAAVPGMRSEMVAPLIVDGRTIGVVNVESPHLGAFSEDDLRLLTTLAGQLAVILDKSRLDAELAQYTATLEQRIEERTAELRAANAELARAARLKDEFMASMSHELRTPLNAILGMSEALQEQLFGPLNEKQLKFLGIIEQSGRHLLALINDILDIAKAEAGKIELELGPVMVELVCQASLQMVAQSAYEKQITVHSTFDSQVKQIQADERRLKQILVNLLSNAVKFTPEGGNIGLTVQADADEGLVRFTVWDTGIGIAPQDMDKLFKPFVQLDSGLARKYSGTGLGLSLVHRLVELHGGSISVESEVGKGSRFTVCLPWIGTAESEQPGAGEEMPPAGAVTPHRPITVLLAEDSETNIVTISDYLSARGHRVIVARQGSEAVQRAQTDKPDVILMDIHLPGMDGLEVIRRIRADTAPDVAKIPIIVLTALAMPGDRERCLEAGADEYISKPAKLKTLLSTIEALCS